MKSRKTPPKEGAGSGCMARLVRFSSSSLEWIDRHDPILFMCGLIWRLNVACEVKFILCLVMGQIVGLALGAVMITCVLNPTLGPRLQERRQLQSQKQISPQIEQSEAQSSTTAYPTHEKPE